MKSHKTSLTSVCPFNSQHVMPPSQLRNHMAMCEDRFRIGKEVKLSSMKPDENSAWYEFGEDEDWDRELAESRAINKNLKPKSVVDPTDT
jgi:hypothetical protein